MPVPFEDIILDVGFRSDFFLDQRVIVECKSVDELHPIGQAKLLNYFKITKLQVGLLINFNVLFLKDGIKRIVNSFKG